MARKIQAKRVLELRAQGMTGRARLGAGYVTQELVDGVPFDAADKAGINSDGHVNRSDAEVYSLPFPGRGEHESVFAQPEWGAVHKELDKVRSRRNCSMANRRVRDERAALDGLRPIQ